MKIFKYPLELTDSQFIKMPSHAVPLSIQMQHGTACLWAAVTPINSIIERQVVMVGTGHEAPDLTGFRFMGTIQLQGGALILHCFIQQDVFLHRGQTVAELPR